MKRVSVLFCIILLFSSCSVSKPKIIGTYKSSCILYGYPDLVVSFNVDSTFTYKMPYVKDIVGKWIIEQDTLVLTSDKFPNQPPSESFPADEYNKYTNLNGRDAFLIKGQKLYTCNKEGCTKTCFLKKQK